ncbi:disintegrin and metalloproteinase domain-containing protein 8 isoform X2 [Ambystoma mexicanum]|uniref:disintegrin and metalloproteinase domain-containing protein 8 isoform X2 n=1 Tax=Ambystoma mexicanum TaxID=8296 RepID=UPI0037E71705
MEWLWVLLGLSAALECSASQSVTLEHAQQYETVIPRRVDVGRRRRDAVYQTASQNTYPDTVQYTIRAENRDYILDLQKNTGLLGKNYTEWYYSEEGAEVRVQPQPKDHCFYHGSVLGIEGSSVSLSTCSGLRGFFQTEGQAYLIEPLSTSGGVEAAHAVYRYEHLRTKRATCGSSNATIYDNGPRVAAMMNPIHWKSAPLQKGTRYVELLLVVDNTEYRKYKDLITLRNRMQEIVNHVDKLYQSLNFRVALIGLEIWNRDDQIVVSSDAGITLDNFLAWRKKYLMKKKKHDNAQLVTGVNFDGSTVGLATKLAMCTGDSGAVNQDHSESPFGAASTMAHEMGHNLGMSHDEEVAGCGCEISKENGGCVMAKSVGQKYPKFFSSCSKKDLLNFLSSAQTSCLWNEPDAEDLYGGPVCGNQFLERGEECDCGSLEECTNPCCNATTCRLKNGAECAHGDCCHQCQIRAVGDVCRRSQGDCDLQEYCTGKSADCPNDAFKENGSPCRSGGGYCYNGACPSHAQHCKTLWGPGAQVASDLCFQNNVQGVRGFNCQKNGRVYKACNRKDVMCGQLHCISGDDLPITRWKYWIKLGNGIECNVAELPDGESEGSAGSDPGLVPTGTKCNKDMVCFEGQCQGLAVYGARNCSAKCNSRGVCNHKRECHCDPGWAPPDCARKLSDTATGGAALTLVAVLVSLILLAILIIGGIAYYRWSQKKTSQKSSASGLSNPLFQERSNRTTAKSDTSYQIISRPRLIATTSDLQDTKSLYITMLPNSTPPEPAPTAPGAHHRSPNAGPKMAQVAKPSSAPPLPPGMPRGPKPSAGLQLPPITKEPPKAVPTYSQVKPTPPKKPLPQLKVKQEGQFMAAHAAPVPPVKPTGLKPVGQSQVSHPKVALKPPLKLR